MKHNRSFSLALLAIGFAACTSDRLNETGAPNATATPDPSEPAENPTGAGGTPALGGKASDVGAPVQPSYAVAGVGPVNLGGAGASVTVRVDGIGATSASVTGGADATGPVGTGGAGATSASVTGGADASSPVGTGGAGATGASGTGGAGATGANGATGAIMTGNTEGNGSKTLAQLIAAIQPLPSPAADQQPQVTSSETRTEQREEGTFTCTYQHMKGVAQQQDLVAFDPMADSLWPGALVQGKSINQGLLTPIGLKRAPGTIVMSNASLTGSSGALSATSRAIAEPSQSTVQDGIQSLLASSSAVNYAAKLDFSMRSVKSFEEAAYAVGLNVKWMSNEVKTKFDYSSWQQKTNLVVKVLQSYYTVSFQPPESPSSFFAPSVTAENAQVYMGTGNPPLYVASVVYGRMLMMRVESERSESELRAALDASFKSGKAAVGLNAAQKQTLDEAKFTVFALGGSSSKVAEVVTLGFEKFSDYLQQGANFSPSSPGVPISYTLRQLTNNEAVRVAYATEYTIPDCALNQDQFRVFIDSIKFIENGNAIGRGDNDYRIQVKDALGAVQLDLAGSVSSKDDEVFNIDENVTFFVGETPGAQFSVSFTANDRGAGEKENVTATKYHAFAASSGAWSNLGDQTLLDSAGDLKVQVRYSVSLIQ